MENITYKKENHIGIITLSRPKALNVINIEMLKEIDELMDEIEKDKDIYCLIITGEGKKAFAAGADISEMKDMDIYEAREYSIFGNNVYTKIEEYRKPVIAAINGYTLGGGLELALSCDIRIASEKSKFGLPEVTLGIIPGFGGNQRLPRTIGIGKAKELIYTGEMIDAKEAHEIGLVNKVVDAEKLIEEVIKIAKKISGNAPVAVTCAKTVINNGIQTDINTALKLDEEVFSKCFTTKDQSDAMNAFVKKEKLEGFKNR